MSSDKSKCLKWLKYEKLVKENYQTTLREYILEKYFELQNQLIYIKDFIIWENSFSQYLKLFFEIFLNYHLVNSLKWIHFVRLIKLVTF